MKSLFNNHWSDTELFRQLPKFDVHSPSIDFKVKLVSVYTAKCERTLHVTIHVQTFNPAFSYLCLFYLFVEIILIIFSSAFSFNILPSVILQ